MSDYNSEIDWETYDEMLGPIYPENSFNLPTAVGWYARSGYANLYWLDEQGDFHIGTRNGHLVSHAAVSEETLTLMVPDDQHSKEQKWQEGAEAMELYRDDLEAGNPSAAYPQNPYLLS